MRSVALEFRVRFIVLIVEPQFQARFHRGFRGHRRGVHAASGVLCLSGHRRLPRPGCGAAPATAVFLISGMEEGKRSHELFALASQLLGRRSHLLRGRCVLLDHLLQLLQGLVDLLGAGVLFLRGRGDLLHQLGRALDVGHQFFQHLAGFLD